MKAGIPNNPVGQLFNEISALKKTLMNAQELDDVQIATHVQDLKAKIAELSAFKKGKVREFKDCLSPVFSNLTIEKEITAAVNAAVQASQINPFEIIPIENISVIYEYRAKEVNRAFEKKRRELEIDPVRDCYQEIMKLKERLDNSKDLDNQQLSECMHSLFDEKLVKMRELQQSHPAQYKRLEKKIKVGIKGAIDAAAKVHRDEIVKKVPEDDPLLVNYEDIYQINSYLKSVHASESEQIRSAINDLSKRIAKLRELKQESLNQLALGTIEGYKNYLRYQQFEAMIQKEVNYAQKLVTDAVYDIVKANDGKMIVEVSDREWEEALKYFANTSSMKLDKKTNPELKLKHSFVKVEDEIYAIDPGKVITQEEIDMIFGEGWPIKHARFQDTKRFKDLNILGQGGVGKVKRVQSQKDKKIDAIKMEDYRSTVKTARRNEEEAEALAIMRQLGYLKGVALREGKKRYIATELLRGESLYEFLRIYTDNQDHSTLSETYQLLTAIKACLAIYDLHKKGIIHKDVKPKNFMIDGKGDIRAIDLDTTMRVEDDDAVRIGEFFGTPLYFAPEVMKANKNELMRKYKSHKAEAISAELKKATHLAQEAGTYDLANPPQYDDKNTSDIVDWYNTLMKVYNEYQKAYPRANEQAAYSTKSDIFSLGLMLKYDIQLKGDAKIIIDQMLAPDPKNRPALPAVLKALVAILEHQPDYQSNLQAQETVAAVKASLAPLESKVEKIPGKKKEKRAKSITPGRDVTVEKAHRESEASPKTAEFDMDKDFPTFPKKKG